MSNNFIPNYGNEANFPNDIVNGNLYISEDTKRIFADLNNNRIQISDVLFVDSKPLIGITNKLYVVKSDNSLWIFNNNWIQLNSGGGQPSSDVLIDNQTITKNSNQELQSIGTLDNNGDVIKYWTGTKVQYDLIENKDDNTIYNITDDVILVEEDHFIPAGTILTVETDGSGDFTNLSSAINYLNGKYSNGSVTIKLGDGTFQEAEPLIIDGTRFNFSQLNIVGNGSTKTIINMNISAGDVTEINKILPTTFCFLSNFKIISPGRILMIYGQVITQDLAIEGTSSTNSNACIFVYGGGHLHIKGTITTNKSEMGICSNSLVTMEYSATHICANCTIGLFVVRGGEIKLNNVKLQYTSVTNVTNQTIGTANATGYISGTKQ